MGSFENSIELLKKYYPTAESAAAEIINLQAILNLPKGTEHFLSDLHGEYEAFAHLVRSASGVIRTKVEEVFSGSLSDKEKNELATLIYYPQERLSFLESSGEKTPAFYEAVLPRLIVIAKTVATKYTRSRVRKLLPSKFPYILDELLNKPENMVNKEFYYGEIISSIIELGFADEFIGDLCILIQRLAIDKLHIVGDIFDRGPAADRIFDRLLFYQDVDIQWGNHDILWMGAAFGNPACIANVIRINSMYHNLHTLESAYGINLRPLALFAVKTYASTDLSAFHLKDSYKENGLFRDETEMACMHKAIAVIQQKAEEQLIAAHPEFEMDGRCVFSRYREGKFLLDGELYEAKTDLPTVEAAGTDFTPEEAELLEGLCYDFLHSEKLRRHIELLISRGSMYLVENGNLLFHGCVPTEEDGTFSEVTVAGRIYSGKALYDRLDALVRQAARKSEYAVSYLWYLWCGKKSPLFGRSVMAIAEKYFVAREMHEIPDPYYKFVNGKEYCRKVLREFSAEKHIINGHIPVRVKKGESPISAGGLRIEIDGGLSKAYQQQTGIAGYTLISNSQRLVLVRHMPFAGKKLAVENTEDMHSSREVLEEYESRIFIKQTDKGAEIKQQIDALTYLIKQYKGSQLRH